MKTSAQIKQGDSHMHAIWTCKCGIRHMRPVMVSFAKIGEVIWISCDCDTLMKFCVNDNFQLSQAL